MTWIEFLKLMMLADKSRSAKRASEQISVEQVAKLVTATSAVCFAIGVICTSIYFASVSLRPFEPLSVQQIFLGALFLTVSVLTLVIPARLGAHSVTSWLIQVATALYLVFDAQFTNHIAYMLGANVVHIQQDHFFQIATNKAEGLFYFLVAATAFRLLAAQLGTKQGVDTKRVAVWLSIGAITSLLVFGTNGYQRIPLALGGGDFPVVRIQFTDDAPYPVTMNFDASYGDSKYQGHRYWARLVHREKDTLYLASPFWFHKTVYEVRSKDIVLMEFGDFNPTTYILPEK